MVNYEKYGMKIIQVYGVDNKGVCKCSKNANCLSPGKHPIGMEWTKKGTDDQVLINKWLSYNNIGLLTGKSSMISVLDIDDIDKLEILEQKYGKLPNTPTTRTGKGGLQKFFRHDERWDKLKNTVKCIPGCDIRSNDAMVVLPPSKTVNQYKWEISPDDCDFAGAPQWIFDLYEQHKKSKTYKIPHIKSEYDKALLYINKVPGAISGNGGHPATFGLTCALIKNFDLTDDELLEVLCEWNKKCIPEWSIAELEHKISDARTKATFEPKDKTPVDIDTPEMDQLAFQGILGDIIYSIKDETEASPALLLTTLLALLGQVVGKGIYYITNGAERTYANIYVVAVGNTGDGKGIALGNAKYILGEHYLGLKTSSSLTSGEGLINLIADKEGELSVKKLCCIDTEFGRMFANIARDKSTLSEILREAWDCTPLQNNTRNNSQTSNNNYVSLIGHITPEELKLSVGKNAVQMFNGFANRILWCYSKSTKDLPNGGNIEVVDKYRDTLRERIALARTFNHITMSDEAKVIWNENYSELKKAKGGLYGSAVSRARVYVLKIAMLYAVIDGKTSIEKEHILASLAVWQYCDDTARYLWSTENKSHRSKVYQTIKANAGIAKSEIRKCDTQFKTDTEAMDNTINSLVKDNKIVEMSYHDERINRQITTYYEYPDIETEINNTFKKYGGI